jgi:nucleoside-diphosphate-sugar epimerase
MKIVVTGSAGFIGHALAYVLVEKGHTVLGIDRVMAEGLTGGLKQEVCDIRDRAPLIEAFTGFAPSAVVHLAARTDLGETKDIAGYAANIEGVRNVVAAIEASGSVERVVFTSSQLVCRVGYVPASDADYAPSTLYGESKIRTEQIVREAEGGDVTWCLVRPTTIWGPGMSAHYRRFLSMIERGLYFHVGDAPLYKSYGYLGNTVLQYSALLTAPPEDIHGKTLYLADAPPLSLRAWANAIQCEMGAPRIRTMPIGLARSLARIGDAINSVGLSGFPFNSFRVGNMLTEYRYDLSETLRICGPARYSMEEGVRELVAWYRGTPQPDFASARSGQASL